MIITVYYHIIACIFGFSYETVQMFGVWFLLQEVLTVESEVRAGSHIGWIKTPQDLKAQKCFSEYVISSHSHVRHILDLMCTCVYIYIHVYWMMFSLHHITSASFWIGGESYDSPSIVSFIFANPEILHQEKPARPGLESKGTSLVGSSHLRSINCNHRPICWDQNIILQSWGE